MVVQGVSVTIRRTTDADLPDLMALWNDGRVMKWVGFPDGLGYDPESIREWYTRLESNSDRHHFVVHAEDLGFCGEVYYAVEKAHRRAGLDIKFVPKAQGRGLATDALKRLIRIVFESEPDVHAVWTEPSEENIAARKLYERCGLRPKPRPLDIQQRPLYWELRREDWAGMRLSPVTAAGTALACSSVPAQNALAPAAGRTHRWTPGEMNDRLKSLLRAFRDEALVYRSVMADPRCPRVSRWLLRAAVAYALSPVDLIPDFIPVLGYVDDLLILPVLVWLAVRAIPKELVLEHRSRREESKRRDSPKAPSTATE